MPISLFEMTYPQVVFVADIESETRFSKFKMADPISRSRYLKNILIFIKLSQKTWNALAWGILGRW